MANRTAIETGYGVTDPIWVETIRPSQGPQYPPEVAPWLLVVSLRTRTCVLGLVADA